VNFWIVRDKWWGRSGFWRKTKEGVRGIFEHRFFSVKLF
jgi:hypothetical protein